MKKSLIINEEREFFLLLALIEPSIMLLLFYVLYLSWWLLLLLILWISIFTILYLYFHGTIVIENDSIIIKTYMKKYLIKFDDIAFLYKRDNCDYVDNVTFTIKFKRIMEIPTRYRLVKNKKFQKMIDNNEINVPIISSKIL